MDNPTQKKVPARRPWSVARGALKPKAISVSQDRLVEARQLEPGNLLPLVIEPAVSVVNLTMWAVSNREFLETHLLKHGAILFRNFGLSTVSDFQQFVSAASGQLMEYRERSSPRHEVGDKVYTSTDYPADQQIFPHNEHSYSLKLPLKLFFFCMTAAEQGGETPIADCRKIYRRIDPQIRERFKQYLYVRNFGDGFGLPWQVAFQTSDKAVVEEYCRKNIIEFEWRDGDCLRTRQLRPTVAHHPRSGEAVWFNHATFFHVSTLEPSIRDPLLASFREEDLPNNTYYADGSPIEPAVMESLRAAYWQERVIFSWQEGDVLMLDNMLTAHSRTSFVGPRRVLFAMTEPFTRTDL